MRVPGNVAATLVWVNGPASPLVATFANPMIMATRLRGRLTTSAWSVPALVVLPLLVLTAGGSARGMRSLVPHRVVGKTLTPGEQQSANLR